MSVENGAEPRPIESQALATPRNKGGRPKGSRTRPIDERKQKPVKEDDTFGFIKEVWGISRKYVIEQGYASGVYRSEQLGIAASPWYWREGSKHDYALDVIGGRSEVLSMKELWFLYSFTCKGLKVLGIEITFEQWLDLRDRARKDLYWLATQVLGIPLVDEVHRCLTDDVYPHLNADGMFGLDYTLVEMHEGIAKQDLVTQEFLILDPRAWMKTALSSAFVVQFLLNFPESRVFNVSGNEDLSEASLKIQKGYWGHISGLPANALQLLFPEYVLHGMDASSEKPITLPCRRFFQKNESYLTFGVTSKSSGAHCDLYVADDVVQEAGTETSRAALKDRADTLMSNVPDAWALKLTLATRYHLEDWYSHKVKLLEEDPLSMRYHCRGVFMPKPGFENVPIQDLKLEEVDLGWPTQLGTPEKTFAAYRRQMRINLTDFLNQKMNSPISDEEADNKLAFDAEKFPSLFIDPLLIPKQGDLHLIVDIAWRNDDNLRADYSVLGVGRVGKSLNSSEELSLYIIHIDAQRRRSSELALAVVETSMRFPLKMIWVEKIGGSEAVIDEIRRLAAMRGHVLPRLYAVPVIPTTHAKFQRIKQLEIAVSQERLWFSKEISATQSALTIEQFLRYKGKRSTTRKDDIPDAVALLFRYVMPPTDPNKKEDAARIKEMQAALDAEEMDKHYQMIFGMPRGSEFMPPPKTKTESEEYAELSPRVINDSPLMRTLNAGGLVRVNPNKKPVSFSWMKEKGHR